MKALQWQIHTVTPTTITTSSTTRTRTPLVVVVAPVTVAPIDSSLPASPILEIIDIAFNLVDEKYFGRYDEQFRHKPDIENVFI